MGLLNPNQHVNEMGLQPAGTEILSTPSPVSAVEAEIQAQPVPQPAPTESPEMDTLPTWDGEDDVNPMAAEMPELYSTPASSPSANGDGSQTPPSTLAANPSQQQKVSPKQKMLISGEEDDEARAKDLTSVLKRPCVTSPDISAGLREHDLDLIPSARNFEGF